MPILNYTPRAFREDWATGVTQTTAASPVRYGPFFSDAFTRCIIRIDRTASTGAQTMDAALQVQDATGDFVSFLDHAGNAVSFVQWADDSHIHKSIEVGTGVLSGDADDTITFGTNFKAYNVSLPPEWYILVTGASGTDDTFTGIIDWLP